MFFLKKLSGNKTTIAIDELIEFIILLSLKIILDYYNNIRIFVNHNSVFTLTLCTHYYNFEPELCFIFLS